MATLKVFNERLEILAMFKHGGDAPDCLIIKPDKQIFVRFGSVYNGDHYDYKPATIETFRLVIGD